MIARALRRTGHGHLVCTDGSERSEILIKKEALLAKKSDFPLSIISVARDENEVNIAKEAVSKAEAIIEDLNVTIESTYTPVGDPVREIIEVGKNYSLIALADTGRTGLKKFFMGSVAFQVMEHAKNSVLVVR